ncbi:hypothetical protein HF086_000917, partial [Spodoptera exigua]
MQKLQDSVFSIVKTTNLSPAVFSFLQPTEDFSDKTPLGGILKDTKHGWLALGPKFCVVDLRTGLKVAARTFGAPQSNANTFVTSVVELPRPLTANSIQLIISLQCDEAGMICVLHVNGSQILRCVQTEVVVTELAVWDRIPDGPLACFDGVVMAGTKTLKDISQGYENLVLNDMNPANLSFLQFSALNRIREQRELALENCEHLAILLNENSLVDGQYIFRNPDGTVRMKAKRDHIRVTVLQYIPQLGSLAVGYNFGAFQIWNIMTLDLEFTSQVNVECLPVTHFGFQEPCDDPRAFCYLWVVFSVIDRFEEEEFPLAVMYSLTYQGKRMLSDTKCLYQEFSTATIRFQLELSTVDESALLGGKCMLNICQVVWECWGENANSSTQYGMLLFDLDQWYKDQMPATWRLESNAFMSVTWCCELSAGDCVTLDVRLDPASVAVYSHATRLEEHFYPNSLQYNCICLNTSEACVLGTVGIQRQIIASIDEVGPTALLNPTRLYNACVTAGLTPLYVHTSSSNISLEEQRRYLLSVCLEARLSRLLKRCAHDWATGTHAGAGCTLPFLVEWSWKRAIELKENAKELTAPLFSSSALPDRNVVRCLEHCVQQLTQLTGLLDAVLTKCCNLIIPDALSEIEEKYKGIGTVSIYFQVVQWFLRVGLLPERHDGYNALPYPAPQLYSLYNKRLWIKGGSQCNGLYPAPSLYSLLRLYLLPDIAVEHKHSLVLYLLVDYSMVYDEVRYEAVIRRLMQFPTMFGLSNTAIKATQAFWHLDHRDFDKKTQAALQYLHVRKPAPIQNIRDRDGDMATCSIRVNDHDKLDDWQSCCNLYLARGLVFEALDVIRICVMNAGCVEDKVTVLQYFFKGCRNTGNLSKILQVTMSPFEEEVFIKYLEDCNDPHTKLKQWKGRGAEVSTSAESLLELVERDSARDALVEVVYAALPAITNTVATIAFDNTDVEPHVIAPKPMSVFVKAKSPKNTFTYKSSFIQDTIENASETWMNKPKMRRGIKRALNIEETPFICTPKLNRTRSILSSEQKTSESTPSKRARLDLTGTPRTPKGSSRVSEKLSTQMATLLDMPDVQSPECKLYTERAGTPHSILKNENHPLESPPKKLATEQSVKGRKSFKDTVRARSRNTTPERLDSPVATSLRGSRITRSRSRTPDLSPRTSPLAPIPELPRHEAHSEPHPEKTTLSVPRRLRSRSRTPDRVDKGIAESPRLEAITESPTKSTNTESSSSSSPTRRSLRSRSRTPEIEVVQEIVSKPSPRSLRSRSKTPEKLMSPKKDTARSKKSSLSRKAFENILSAKVKQADKMDTDNEDKPVVAIECTPMKTLKQVPNLMDVTLSPIVNKSVLQSSTDTTLSETVEKEVKTDKSALETDLKPFPAFTTLHETCVEKSVLHSYQSSVADITDTSINIREEKVVVEKSEMSVLKPLPAFTLNETEFDKSVLKSYQSSVADESSLQEDKETQADNNTSKPFAAFVQMIQTDFEKSVLRSAESSVAEASQFKDDSKAQEASSLMTNDSDADIEMDENVDTKKSAAEQKEKEKIVEIEREIDEIQDMSDEDDQDGSETSGDERDDEGESGSEASDESEQIPKAEKLELPETKDVAINDGKTCVTLNASNTSNEGMEENDEVISIEDSDESSDKLEIDEKSKDSGKSEEQNINNEANNLEKDSLKDKEILQEQKDEIANETATQVESSDKFNQANFSLMTDDNSIASDKSDLNLNYSGESAKTTASNEKPEGVDKEPTVHVEATSSVDKAKDLAPAEEDNTAQVKTPKEMNIEPEQKSTSEEVKESDNKEKTENIPEKENVAEVPKEQETERKTKDTQKETEGEETEEVVEQPTRSRKRGKSTSSNKSTTEDTTVETEIKTPATRKRTQSNASNKSVDTEQKTPESADVTTPSRRRAKTPTSAEVRKIITRRVSREMSEKHDDSKALDESVTTPKRRSTRSRSKNFDDNESVASESSVASVRSKASEDAGDRAVRKGRKSVLVSKPELSVIPEVTVEDNSRMDTENVINEYSSARRLTRHQKAVLESWLEPQAQASPRRRLSTASRTSRTSHTSRSVASEADDDDASSTHSAAFDVQPIDRISLLNKTDFEGLADPDELQMDFSPESIASDASKQRRARLGRAASETKATPRAAKINRRISVDVGKFTISDAKKGDTESPVESPAASESEAATPARRTRRAASVVSNTSQANSESGKRSKKTGLDE